MNQNIVSAFFERQFAYCWSWMSCYNACIKMWRDVGLKRRCRLMLTWTGELCLCWEADWDLLFFDQRHNKITSLPLSTTNTLPIHPLISAWSSTSTASVWNKTQKGQPCNTTQGLEMLQFKPFPPLCCCLKSLLHCHLCRIQSCRADVDVVMQRSSRWAGGVLMGCELWML